MGVLLEEQFVLWGELIVTAVIKGSLAIDWIGRRESVMPK